jgi:SpoVK/Ycf46/Vps4 family AAA+-type ATPase
MPPTIRERLTASYSAAGTRTTTVVASAHNVVVVLTVTAPALARARGPRTPATAAGTRRPAAAMHDSDVCGDNDGGACCCPGRRDGSRLCPAAAAAARPPSGAASAAAAEALPLLLPPFAPLTHRIGVVVPWALPPRRARRALIAESARGLLLAPGLSAGSDALTEAGAGVRAVAAARGLPAPAKGETCALFEYLARATSGFTPRDIAALTQSAAAAAVAEAVDAHVDAVLARDRAHAHARPRTHTEPVKRARAADTHTAAAAASAAEVRAGRSSLSAAVAAGQRAALDERERARPVPGIADADADADSDCSGNDDDDGRGRPSSKHHHGVTRGNLAFARSLRAALDASDPGSRARAAAAVAAATGLRAGGGSDADVEGDADAHAELDAILDAADPASERDRRRHIAAALAAGGKPGAAAPKLSLPANADTASTGSNGVRDSDSYLFSRFPSLKRSATTAAVDVAPAVVPIPTLLSPQLRASTAVSARHFLTALAEHPRTLADVRAAVAAALQRAAHAAAAAAAGDCYDNEDDGDNHKYGSDAVAGGRLAVSAELLSMLLRPLPRTAPATSAAAGTAAAADAAEESAREAWAQVAQSTEGAATSRQMPIRKSASAAALPTSAPRSGVAGRAAASAAAAAAASTKPPLTGGVSGGAGDGPVRVPTVRWSDVGGNTVLKRTVRDVVEAPLLYPQLFRRYGVAPASGVLLYGPPGCGKTLVAKAIANEVKASFISVSVAEMMSPYVGEAEGKIRALFARARAASPCVIFFDELDALFSRRSSGGESASTVDRTVGQILTEMDNPLHLDAGGSDVVVVEEEVTEEIPAHESGAEDEDKDSNNNGGAGAGEPMADSSAAPRMRTRTVLRRRIVRRPPAAGAGHSGPVVFIIGATNRPEAVDPALLRPGRLEHLLYVGLPGAAARLDIMAKTLGMRTSSRDALGTAAGAGEEEEEETHLASDLTGI